jgi:hypothetical protein
VGSSVQNAKVSICGTGRKFAEYDQRDLKKIENEMNHRTQKVS